MTILLLVALAVAVVVIVILLILDAVYRSTHGYTESDIASARRDSLARSRNVVSGKVQEHLVPLFPEFLAVFNPRDARFLGSPIAPAVSSSRASSWRGGVRRMTLYETRPSLDGVADLTLALAEGRLPRLYLHEYHLAALLAVVQPVEDDEDGWASQTGARGAAECLLRARRKRFSTRGTDRRSRCESRPLPPKAMRTIIF